MQQLYDDDKKKLGAIIDSSIIENYRSIIAPLDEMSMG